MSAGVMRLIAAVAVLGGAATLLLLLLRNPEGGLPLAVAAWCLLILGLTVLLVVRASRAPTGGRGRAFVLLYGLVFVGGLILVVFAFTML